MFTSDPHRSRHSWFHLLTAILRTVGMGLWWL